MATAAIASYGTTLQWNAQPLAELTNISGPSISIDSIDVTSYSSANAFKEFIAGFADGGEVTIEGNFIPGDTAGQRAFITDAKAKTVRQVIITSTTASFTWTFNALVTSVEFDDPLEEQFKFSATMKISGKPVLAITASANSSALSFIDSVGAKTPIPAYAAGTYIYTLTIANASGWIKITTTHATAVSIIATALGVAHVLATTVQSEQILVSAADSVTTVTIDYKDTGKITKRYTIYVQRP